MQLINARFSLTFALTLAPLVSLAAPIDPYLPQIESRNVSALSWSNLLETLRSGKVPKLGDLSVKVTDISGQPLSGVTVLVGQAAGDPFVGNQAVTDSSGVVSFTNDALKTGKAFTITASLPGRTTVSLVDNKENSVEIALQNPPSRGYGFLRGKLNGIPKQGGGTLEMGFFIPAARPESLLNFDIQSFVSSYTVKVNVYGDRDIPGNVVLPSQTKFYGIVPISISKPDYIMPLATGLTTHMYGLAGGIGIQAAVDAVQKKDFLAVLNLTSLTNVGWTRDRVTVKGNDNFDINANHAIVPNSVHAQLSGVPAKLDAVTVSLVDPSGDKGDYVAMDVKALKSENMQAGGGTLHLGQIKSRRAADRMYLFTALFDKSQIQNSQSRWVVGSVQPVQNRSTVPFTKFLSPIQTGSVASANREYKFTSPANGALTPNYVLVNIVSEKNNAETMGTDRTVLWSAVVPGATNRVMLPDLGRPVLPTPDSSKGEKFHWEVIGLRSATAATDGINLQEALKDLTDVSTLTKAY